MRNPSFRAAMLAGASLLVSGFALAAGAPTPAEPSAPADASNKATTPLVVDRADWAPEHGLPVALSAPKAGIQSAAATSKQARDADQMDPEADGVTVPTTSEPSHDPLDRARAAAPKAGEATKAGDAAKTDSSKTDASKADASKADASKTDAAKTDAGQPSEKTTQQAEQPLPPLNAAIKAALDVRAADAIKGPGAAEKKKEREAIAFFYAAHGFAPAWSEKGQAIAAVAPVLSRLARAGDDALALAVPPPKTLVTDGKPEDLAESDIAVTEAVVSYARQATGSRIDPSTISPLIGARPDLADPAEVLDSLVAAGEQAGAKLEALNPSEPRYVALRRKLGELRAQRMPGLATVLPPGPTLKIGMRDKRVPLLRSRFGLSAEPDGDANETYDREVAAAVTDFQKGKGLSPTGHLNKATVAALAGEKPSRNQGTIIANMEMWRWMPRDLGADRIEVNVPAYTATVYHEGEPVATHRVVVGKTDTPTPLFSNTMKFLIVNPVWNVPVSIIKNEFLPKGGGDLSYLQSRGYEVSYHHGLPVVKQPAGAGNALGRIKFMFPNRYSVYLHDTPAKALFSSAKRAFSHGCVRVDKPFDFAETVLNDSVPEGGKVLWSQKRLDKMLGNSERYVDLPKPLPIHIEYFTASVDEGGVLSTREDIYGYAGAVAAALGVGSGSAPPVALPKPAAPVVAERKTRTVAERPRRRHLAERAQRQAPDVYEDRAETEPAPRAPSQGIFGFLPF